MSAAPDAPFAAPSAPHEAPSDRTGADLALALDGLTHRYHATTPVLKRLALALPAGEYACLLGDSGSGKSTLLQLIAGIDRLQSGRLAIAGRTVADAARGIHVAPERRGLGMVFQDQALWPHLSVQAHVEFPLRAQRRRIDAAALADLLRRVGLDGLEQRRPGALSGGQRQRVGLARALAGNPRLLLLDEPLSAVDTAMRGELRAYLRRLFEELGFTALHVTHDPDEAFELATRIGVLENGELVQWDTPERLYRRPASLNVARLSGPCGIVEVDCLERLDGGARIRWQERTYVVPAHGAVRRGRAHLLLRPDTLRPAPGGLPARFSDVRYQGDRWLAHAHVGRDVPLPVHLSVPPGDSLTLQLHENSAWLLP